MAITVTTEGSTITIAVSGWLDTSTVPELEQAITGLDLTNSDVVLDFSELEYISSAGLRQLVLAHRMTKGRLTIVNVPDDVMAVLTMAGFGKRLNIK